MATLKILLTISVLILLSQYFDGFLNGFSFQSKTIKLTSFSECPEDEETPIRFNGTITRSLRNKYAVNGEFRLNKTIAGPLEVIHFK